MPKRRPKTVQPKTDQIRHKYGPGDQVANEAWKDLYPLTDPQVSVSLDAGTFHWLWDFVARKGRQADADNFQNYSPILTNTYQRAANQFAIAAFEAYGDQYMIDPDAGPVEEDAPEVTGEAPVAPVQRRRRRKTAETTEKSFSASKKPRKPSEANVEEKPRSRRRKKRPNT